MSDPVEVPEEAILLAQATEIVRTDLVQSIRSALLMAEGSAEERAKVAVAAVFRILAMPGGMATAVAYVAGVRLDDELKRTVVTAGTPLPPRGSLATLSAGPMRRLEELLMGSFTAIVAGYTSDMPGAEHNTATILADEAIYLIQSHRGAPCVAWLCGAMAGTVLGEARGGAA